MEEQMAVYQYVPLNPKTHAQSTPANSISPDPVENMVYGGLYIMNDIRWVCKLMVLIPGEAHNPCLIRALSFQCSPEVLESRIQEHGRVELKYIKKTTNNPDFNYKTTREAIMKASVEANIKYAHNLQLLS